MTTVGEISVKISADLAPLRKAQMEAKRITGEMDRALNASAQTIGAAFGQTWGAQVSQFNAGATQVNANLNKVGQQMNQTAKSANGYANNIRSAGQFSGLAAMQFNDLAVQLASGQSAFIAITQQGAQLVQMFEPGTGIGAAARGLGSAFMQFLVNPLNIALVSIAAVAAAVPMIWDAFSGPEPENAQKVLNRINDLIQDIEKNSPQAAAAIQEIMDRAKSLDELRLGINNEIEQLNEQLDAARDKLQIIRTGGQGGLNRSLGLEGRQIVDTLNDMVRRIKETGEGTQELRQYLLDLSLNPDLSSSIQKIVNDFMAVSDEILQIETRLEAMGTAAEKLPDTTFDGLSQSVENARQSLADGVMSLQEFNSEVDGFQSDAIYFQEQAFRELQSAIDALDPGPAKDSLQEIFDKAKDGEISADEFRTAIERLGLSFDTAGVLGAIQGVANAAIQAKSLVESLRANSVMPDLGTLSPIYSFNGKMTTDQQEYQNYIAENTKSQFQIEQEKLAKRSSRGGKAAANKAAKNTSFLEDIKAENAELERQLQIMSMGSGQQEQMMVQLEKEKFIREGLKKLNEMATPEMRKMYEEQLAKQFELNEAIEKQKKLQNDLRDLGKSVLSGFISDLRQGKSAAEALEGALNKIADKLLDMALDSIFSGGGFGGGGLGSIFGSLFGGGGQFGIASSGGIGLYADGGRISGPGTGRSDSIPIMASNGEFMVNAASTAKYLPLLEAINDNRPIGMFADGGMIRVPNSSIRSSSSSNNGSPVEINIINNSEAKVSQSERKTSGGLALDVLIDDVVSKNMNKPGSSSRSAVQGQFGLSNQLARR